VALLKQQTVLIVEDEPLVRNLMVMVLAGKHYHVLEADNAPEALEVSSKFEGAINLLIADQSLKIMTGRQLAQRIQQSRPQLKVLHMSSDLREKVEQEGGLVSGAALLGKPFLPTDLTARVVQILGSAPDWKT
jgi:DNA-binding response OmpR family regulator